MKVVFSEAFYDVYTMDPAAAEGRMEAMERALRPLGEFVAAEPASLEDLLAVHGRGHVDHVVREGVYDIAALAAGGAIQAATIGLAEPCFGLIRPPGHHASANSAWGFCYFNNMAVALTRLHRDGRFERAYVLDIDLHFGDGTVNILGHQGWVNVHNVEAADRGSYLEEVAEEMARCRADLVGLSAGFDNHRRDWGGTLETEDYEAIGGLVREAVLRQGGGCFALFEGGYNHDTIGPAARALMQGLSGT